MDLTEPKATTSIPTSRSTILKRTPNTASAAAPALSPTPSSSAKRPAEMHSTGVKVVPSVHLQDLPPIILQRSESFFEVLQPLLQTNKKASATRESGCLQSKTGVPTECRTPSNNQTWDFDSLSAYLDRDTKQAAVSPASIRPHGHESRDDDHLDDCDASVGLGDLLRGDGNGIASSEINAMENSMDCSLSGESDGESMRESGGGSHTNTKGTDRGALDAKIGVADIRRTSLLSFGSLHPLHLHIYDDNDHQSDGSHSSNNTSHDLSPSIPTPRVPLLPAAPATAESASVPISAQALTPMSMLTLPPVPAESAQSKMEITIQTEVDINSESATKSMSKNKTKRWADFVPAPRSIRKVQQEWKPKFRDYQDVIWGQYFKQLLQFKATHGHCLVPVKYPENPKLPHWVKRQRYHFKLRKAGFQSNLSDERLERLEGIGFAWDKHAACWEERFEWLRLFKKKYGSCKVRNWRAHLRRSVAAAATTSTSIPAEASAGGETNSNGNSNSSEDNAASAAAGVPDNTDGHEGMDTISIDRARAGAGAGGMIDLDTVLGAPTDPRTEENYRKLACWAKHQRRQYRAMKNGQVTSMTPDRIDRLEKLGFEW